MSTTEGSSVIRFIVNILDSLHCNDTTRVILKQRINSTNILTTKKLRKKHGSKILFHLG